MMPGGASALPSINWRIPVFPQCKLRKTGGCASEHSSADSAEMRRIGKACHVSAFCHRSPQSDLSNRLVHAQREAVLSYWNSDIAAEQMSQTAF